ncbi:MAG: hypothetical protein E6R04_00105 [Spirochaetes bacterium]|nr:MAG: hypothetical protein E6R04_00105 [Spirochaetota bacterium]
MTMAYTPLPTPSPSGDQWGEQLNDAIGDRTNDKIKRIIAGKGLHIDASDPQQPVISRTDIDLLGLQNYRGEWVGENALIYSQDFSDIPSSTTLPPELLVTSSFALSYEEGLLTYTPNPWSIVATATPSPIAEDYPYSINLQSTATHKYFTIYLPKISTFRYQIHTIKFWHREVGGAGALTNVLVDGNTISTIAESDTDVESTVTGFNAYNTITLSSAHGIQNFRYTGIRLYGRVLTPPYVMGDIVSHGGVLYKCIYSTTQQEPGTGAHWEVVPYTMLPPGAPYTEAINATVARSDSRIDDKYDPLWGAPSIYDLEFDTDTSTIPSGWAWLNQGTSTYNQKFGCGVLSTAINADSIITLRGISRDLPSESTWTATAKIIGTNLRSTESFGLILEDSTNGDYVTFGKNMSGITVSHYSDYTTKVSELTPIDISDISYFRVKYISPTNVDFLISSDGVSWNSISTGYNLSGKLTSASKLGVFSSNNEVAAHWLRIRTS